MVSSCEFGSDSQRVKYLQSRFTSKVMSPSEAQELTNIYHRHGKKHKYKTQMMLDKIASSPDKPIKKKYTNGIHAFIELENKKFEDNQKQLNSNREKIEASRENIIANIEAFRKKLR